MARLTLCASVVLVLTCFGLAAQAPPSEQTDTQALAKQPTSRTHTLAARFDRVSLKDALAWISKETGVAIEVERGDLQMEGVTINQSFGLKTPPLTVDELIRNCLLLCNPDDKLAYAVRKNLAGGETVHIVSRKEAGKRGEFLFGEFALLVPQKNEDAAEVAQPWSSSIQAATIEAEIRQKTEALGKALQMDTPEKTARSLVAQLALLFRVIDQYDGNVRWKSEASRVWKDLGNHLPPRSAWNRAQRQQTLDLYKNLQKLLANDNWPQAGDDRPQLTWQQMAPRPEIMQRLDEAMRQHLIPGTGQQASPATALADIQHESEVIAALARVIQSPGYEYADDQDYQSFAQALEQQSLTLTAAAAKKDRAALKLASGQLQKSCSDCHANFR